MQNVFFEKAEARIFENFFVESYLTVCIRPTCSPNNFVGGAAPLLPRFPRLWEY